MWFITWARLPVLGHRRRRFPDCHSALSHDQSIAYCRAQSDEALRSGRGKADRIPIVQRWMWGHRGARSARDHAEIIDTCAHGHLRPPLPNRLQEDLRWSADASESRCSSRTSAAAAALDPELALCPDEACCRSTPAEPKALCAPFIQEG